MGMKKKMYLCGGKEVKSVIKANGERLLANVLGGIPPSTERTQESKVERRKQLGERSRKNMTKEEKYQQVVPQIEALVAGESDEIANMANVAAVLHETFGFWWTGFYRVEGNELVLGPFQGPVACTRIPFGRGVCGTAWAQNKTIVVPNVHDFIGHIACSSISKSEIVVPVRKDGEIVAVLDIDSAEYNTFDATDQAYLERIVLIPLRG